MAGKSACRSYVSRREAAFSTDQPASRAAITLRDVAAPNLLDGLEQEAVLWLIGQGRFADVVGTACDLLVAGYEGDALVELASEPRREPVYPADMDDALRAALAEQGKPLPARESAELQVRAVVAMARRTLAGTFAPRQLAAWTHQVVGHQGVLMAQPLVDLDDRYDTLEFSKDTAERLDGEVLDFCRLVASR